MTVSALRKKTKVIITGTDGKKYTCEVYEVTPDAIMLAAGDVDNKTDAELINAIFPMCCSLTIEEIDALPNPGDVVEIFNAFREVNKRFLQGIALKTQISGNKTKYRPIFTLLSRWDKAFSGLVSGYVQEVSQSQSS